MAAREHQGYLIAVIILVLLALVLALLTFLGMSKANEYYEGMTKAQEDLNVEKLVGEAHQTEAEILRAYVGGQDEILAEVPTKSQSIARLANSNSLTDTQKSAIQSVVDRVTETKKAYERDMQQFIARTEDDQAEELTWSGVLRNLIAVTSVKHNELDVAREQNVRDRDDFRTKLDAHNKALDESQKLLASANEELTSVRKLNQEKEDSLLAELEKAQVEIRQAGQGNENQQAILRKKNGDLRTLNDKLIEDNSKLSTRISTLTVENFDLHDGTIVRVARGSNMVFLDIGSSDGLRTNQTFAVYDNDINNFEKNREKAKIEVTRVTGPHTAVARITEESTVHPPTRGDYIVTPTWDPGFNVPIALAGVFDLDLDGHSDRLQFVRMIENNGGRVVAQHDEDGNILGEIDASTRYLVMGAAPDPGKAGTNGNVYSAIRSLENQAKLNNLQIIDMRKMLNWMGRHNRASVESFGNSIDKSFRSRTPSGSSTR